jgi:outer membrane protein
MRRLLLAGLLIGAAPVHAQTLDAVITAAIDHSPSLLAARARADSAQAKVDEARAERDPIVSLDGEIGTGRLDPQGFFGLDAANVMTRMARATVELPLFTGGRVGAAVRQASGGRDAAKEQVRETELTLRVQVVRAYADALAAEKLTVSYQKLVASLEEVVRQAKLKFRAGDGTNTETAQAKARLAEALAGLAAAQGRLATARSLLQSLTGRPVILSGELPAPPALPPSADDAMSRALASNPQILSAGRVAKAAAAGVDAARAERLPTVGAFAEVSSVRDQFFPGYKAASGILGMRVHWTLFSGGRNAAKEHGAAADLRAAEADFAAARRQVGQQAVACFEDVMTARAVLDAATRRVTATREALADTRLEVQAGAKPQLALLDAERESINAESARMAALGDMLVAAYTLRAIAGMD